MNIKKHVLEIIFILTSFFLSSEDIIKPDISLLNKIKDIKLNYSQNKDGKFFISNVNLKKSIYAEEDIIISKTTSQNEDIIVYLKLNGELIKTKIYDKKEKAKYLIEYEPCISVKKITEKGKTEFFFKESAFDVSALSLLLGLNKPMKDQTYDICIIDYKNGELNKVKLEVVETDSKILYEEMEIDAVKYKISSFLFYDSVFYYGKENFPVLIYYEGPESINLFKRTSVRIIKESYLEALDIFN